MGALVGRLAWTNGLGPLVIGCAVHVVTIEPAVGERRVADEAIAGGIGSGMPGG